MLQIIFSRTSCASAREYSILVQLRLSLRAAVHQKAGKQVHRKPWTNWGLRVETFGGARARLILPILKSMTFDSSRAGCLRRSGYPDLSHGRAARVLAGEMHQRHLLESQGRRAYGAVDRKFDIAPRAESARQCSFFAQCLIHHLFLRLFRAKARS